MSYTSPKSSAESKSTITPEALQSSWIRRLNLRPMSPSSPQGPQPVAMAMACENPSPETPPLTSVNSPSTTESRTPTSMFDANTNLFIHRLLKLRNEKNTPPTSRTDPESETHNGVVGFGPFQVQTSKRVSSIDAQAQAQAQSSSCVKLQETDLKDDHFMHKSGGGWGFGDMGFARQDSVARIDDGWCNRKSSQKMGKNPSLQQNWFPANTTTLFNGETMSSSESNFMETNNNFSRRSEKMDSFPVCDDRSLSPFFRYWTSLKKNEYQGENRTNLQVATTALDRNGAFVDNVDPSGMEKNKFNGNNTIDSCNMNTSWLGETRCLPVERDERLYEPQPMNQMSMARASHESSYFSRNEGMSYHQSCEDGAAGRTSAGFHPTYHNISLRHNGKHVPATCPSETQEASSLSNMNSFQRAEMVSSIFQACRNGTRKRNSNAYDQFFTGKSRKLSPDEG